MTMIDQLTVTHIGTTSFTATDRSGESVRIDAEFVRSTVGELAKNADLSRFIL